jgi:hypothetical protein
MSSTLERAVSAQFERQTFNAVVAGQDIRASQMEEVKKPSISVHQAKTTAPCANCGAQASQLLRRGTTGPFHATCNKIPCMNAVSRSL